MNQVRIATVVAALTITLTPAVLAACGSQPASPSPSAPAPTASPHPAPAQGTSSGTAKPTPSSHIVSSRPARNIGYPRMTDFTQAGDFEGTLTYGIGITRPIPASNPQFAVRAYEVEQVTATGQHRYVVAIDVDATNPT